ncbi:MAG: hypothetical protein JSW58_16715 [Candidatus Latescibacterota bacterium]|nr:MAG: hypothetical protein JSW58_16715 [Candidatus Latescibacterota bacterium]
MKTGKIGVPFPRKGVDIDTLLVTGHKLRFYRVDERLTLDLDGAKRPLDGSASAFYFTHYFGFPKSLTPIRQSCKRPKVSIWRPLEKWILSVTGVARRTLNRRCEDTISSGVRVRIPGWRNHLSELPIHQGLSSSDMDRVADSVLRVTGQD